MLSWRNVGPARGGRSIAAAGNDARPFEYYFGATGGGLWKTTDGGTTWYPVGDGQLASASVGAIAIDQKQPDTVYVGMGEGQLRGNVLQGDGVYKTEDGGKTWRNIGLEKTRTITTLRIHPSDSQLLYAAALGDPFSANKERGVYRSTDGGESWEQILFTSDRAGAIDLAMDPNDPSVLYATLWEVYRKPWKLWSGGPGSAIYKSSDGGDTWTDITRNPGLPDTVLGKMTIAVSPVNSRRVYANIEAEQGGLYRSDDGGMSWSHINGARKLWQRSFYFMQLRPHPTELDTLYILSFKLEKSVDGGAKFKAVPTRHADSHDLWISSSTPERMIVADDGGASVTVNGGQTWTEQDYPTAQIYRLATTNAFPYELCGTQQDNSAICVPSRRAGAFDALGGGPAHVDTFNDYREVAPSENGFVAPHPTKPNLFFISSTNTLYRYDRTTEATTNVSPYPYGVMGQTAASMTERWNWTFPVAFSQADKKTLYVGSQSLWRSQNEGDSWEKISPDLTRAEPETLGETGGPVRLDQDGPEVYGTLYSLAPSPIDAALIWTGSDDGLVHVTRNSGKTWQDVTPPDLPPHSRIGAIDASRHQPGTAYVVAKRYEMADRAPYVYKTDNYGKSWTRIDQGLGAEEFVHSIREDSDVAGLLYLGTEKGVRVSMNGGKSWQSLSLNLPSTPVMGIDVKGDELAIATHGRSFYVLEGLGTLRYLAQNGAPQDVTLFPPNTAVLSAVPATLNFYLPESAKGIRLSIFDAEGKLVSRVPVRLRLDAGGYSASWALFHTGAAMFPGMITEAPPPFFGPKVLPGNYTARLTAGGKTVEQTVTVTSHPAQAEIPMADLVAQRDFALEVRDAVSAANGTVIKIRKLRQQLKKQGGEPSTQTKAFLDELLAVEKQLYQVKNESPKDKIAYPIQLNDRLGILYSNLVFGTGKPTEPQRQVFKLLQEELAAALAAYEAVMAKHAELVAAL
ncbi:MAG: glycosyl hydrolase [Pseudomonadota bacterium]